MTDQALLPPVAAPRPATTNAGRRLSQRFFLLISDRGPYAPSPHSRHGGIAVCGPKARNRVGALAGSGHPGPLIADPGFYTSHTATPDRLFIVADDDLFGSGLERDLDLQIDSGASVALTPTGYLPPGDRGTLSALVDRVGELTREDTVVVVPADVDWLAEADFDFFRDALAEMTHPVALALGGQFNPLDKYPEAAVNLRRLIVEVPTVAPWRTDLTAFDGVAHGAAFASFGLSSSLRHVVPPGEKAQTRGGGGPVPASVLVPWLLGFSSGSVLAKRYANVQPPRCLCTVCAGTPLDRFDGYDGETKNRALAHNAAACVDLVTKLFDLPSLGDQQAWWRAACVTAVNAHSLENDRILQRRAFEPSNDLKRWAALPVTHAPLPARAVGRQAGR